MATDGIRAVEELGLSEGRFIEIANAFALRDMLRPKVRDQAREALFAERDGVNESWYNAILRPYRTKMADVRGYAAQLTPVDVAQYLLGRMESYTWYLETGEYPDDWPEHRGRTDHAQRSNQWAELQSVAELSAVCLTHLRSELGDAWGGLAARHESWLDRSLGLLLPRRLVGRAVSLVNTTTRDEARAWPLVVSLVNGIREVDTYEGVEAAWDLRNFANESLRPHLKQNFARANADRRYIRVASATGPASEDLEFMLGNRRGLRPVSIRLADGTPTKLFHELYELHPSGGLPDAGPEPVIFYDSLNDEQLQAVVAARRPVTLPAGYVPRCARLALSYVQDGAPGLYAVGALDERARYEAVPSNVRLNVVTQRQAEPGKAVAAFTPIVEAYVVVPNAQDWHQVLESVHVQADLQNPAPDVANAFWVNRVPRVVVRRGDQINDMRSLSAGIRDGVERSGTWLLVPVRYYKVATAN